MVARALTAGGLLLALTTERFAYYGFRAQFRAVALARGVAPEEASALYATLTSVVTVVGVLAAVVAFAAPRLWLAPAGMLAALGGHLMAALEPSSGVDSGVMLIAVGTGVTKANLVCAAADMLGSARARYVVGLLGYGALNAGAALAPLGAMGAPAAEFSRLPVAAAVFALVVCCSGAALDLVLKRPLPVAATAPTGLVGVLLLVPASTLMWVMFEVQPMGVDAPQWAHVLNPLVLAPASVVGAVAFALLPERALPLTLVITFGGALVAALGGALGVDARDPTRWLAAQVALTVGECGLGMGAYALALGSLPPRLAPLAMAVMSGAATLVTHFVGRHAEARAPVLVVLGVLALGSFAGFAVCALRPALSQLGLGRLAVTGVESPGRGAPRARST